MKIAAALMVQPGLPTLPPTAVTLSRIIRVNFAVQSFGMPMTIGQTASSKRANCSLSVGAMSLRSAWAIWRRWPWTMIDSSCGCSVDVEARTPTWARPGVAAVAASKAAMKTGMRFTLLSPGPSLLLGRATMSGMSNP